MIGSWWLLVKDSWISKISIKFLYMVNCKKIQTPLGSIKEGFGIEKLRLNLARLSKLTLNI